MSNSELKRQGDPCNGDTGQDGPRNGDMRQDGPRNGDMSQDEPCDGHTSQADPCDGHTAQIGPCDGHTSQADPCSSNVSQSSLSSIGVWVPLREYLASSRIEGVSAGALVQKTWRSIRNGTFGLPTRRAFSRHGQWCYEVWVSEPDTLRDLALRRNILNLSRQYRPQSARIRISHQLRIYWDGVIGNEELRLEFDRMIAKTPVAEFKAVGYNSAQAESSGPAQRKRIRLSSAAWQKLHTIATTYRLSVSDVVASLLVSYCAGKHRTPPCVLQDVKHLAA